MEMNNIFKSSFDSIERRISNLESNIQEIQAFLDQKIDQFEGDLETLESRINNLR